MFLLGNEPVFKRERRVYQRLLAGDQEEAAELVDEDLEHKPLVEVYDTLLIPALALAETDWHRGELDERRHQFILQSLKEMMSRKGRRATSNRRRKRTSRTTNRRGRLSFACPLATRRMKSPE